jgi:hypothetical protein
VSIEWLLFDDVADAVLQDNIRCSAVDVHRGQERCSSLHVKHRAMESMVLMGGLESGV